MLQRKPHIGETLEYNSSLSQGRQFTVTRIEGNILHYKEGNEESLIIWKFRDGLNTCLSHIQE